MVHWTKMKGQSEVDKWQQIIVISDFKTINSSFLFCTLLGMFRSEQIKKRERAGILTKAFDEWSAKLLEGKIGYDPS